METQNGQYQSGAGRIERLENRVCELLRTSADPQLRAYLQDLLRRIAGQKYQLDQLERELDQRCAAVPRPQYIPTPPQRPVRERRSAEFVVGTALSIVGGIFVLIALLLLGMYLTNGFVKGMLLYAVCLAVMAVSELVLYRRWRGMGVTFSAIAIGGLYITTLVNCLSLGNFNAWVCVALTALITAGTLVLSRRRNAVSYRIIGIAACYLSVLVLPTGQLGAAGLYTISGVVFLINLMCILVPIRTHAEAVGIAHLAVHAVCSLTVFCLWADGGDFSYTGSIWPVLVWCGVALLTEQMIYVMQICRKPADGRESSHIGMSIAYGISMLFYVAIAALLGAAGWADAGMTGFFREREVCTIAVCLICAGAIFMLRGRFQRWFPWYLFCLLVLALHIESVSTSPYGYAGALTVLWIVSSLLTFTKESYALIGNAVLTGYACFYMLCTRGETRSFLLLAGMLAAILCINGLRTYFSVILTYTLALYTAYYMLPSLQLPVFVGILFLGLLLFNHVERWKDRHIAVYNILVLVGQAICYLLLLNPVYRNAYLTYFCMLVFGISTIVVCFQPAYHLDFQGRELTAAIFLTYMALIFKTDYDIINSILMMVIALVSVAAGFVSRKKGVRIYGLVVSLLVCAKIVLYDFLGVGMVQRMILFFAVGMIAIAISVIYMVLDKQMHKPAQQEPLATEPMQGQNGEEQRTNVG